MEEATIKSGIIVVVCSAAFIGFCIYVDRFRHKPPTVQKKLKLKRHIKVFEKMELINLDDPRQKQSLILHEIQLAEDLMSSGKYDNAIVHFANAIAVCSDPSNLIRALRKTLPSAAFELLITVLLNTYGKRFSTVGTLQDKKVSFERAK